MLYFSERLVYSFAVKGYISMKNRWTLSELKEIVLSLLAVLWGVVFLLPGDTLGTASRIDLMATYAGDVTWGILLVIGGLFLLFSPRTRHLHIRRWIHAFFWIFWAAITILVVVRSVANGFTTSDVLISSPFLTIALIHAAFYLRLVYVK